jgi:hypothetical protein
MSGQALIHLIKLSMVTTMCVALGTFLKGPTKSSPQTMNDQVIGVEWSAWASKWVRRAWY